jgi:hypothetical protein
MSTVKRRLWDASLLGRVAKKTLRWAKEHRHWTQELFTVDIETGVL